MEVLNVIFPSGTTISGIDLLTIHEQFDDRYCEAWRSLSTIITRKKSKNLFEMRFISNLDSNSSEWFVLFMRSPIGRHT